jgi:hypothetical protein
VPAPAPVSSPMGRPPHDSDAAARGADAVPDSTWTDLGTVTGDVPGGSQHPSFPAGPPPPLPIPANASREFPPAADREPGPEDHPERGQHAAPEEHPEPGQADNTGSDWDGDDWDQGAWDESEPGPPPAPPVWRRRWRLVALVAAAAVLVGVAAVLLRPVLFSEDYRTYTSSQTVIPFRLDHPAAWGSAVGPSSDVVLAPDPTTADDLFFNRGTPDAWATTTNAVRSGSPDAVWLYVYSQATTFDTSDIPTFQDTVKDLLPTTTRFEPTHRELSVGGAPAVEMEAVTADPANQQTQLRVLVDVIQPPSGQGALLLAFFSPPGTFEDHRPTFEKVRDSLQLSG